MELLVVGVLALLTIALTTALAPRFKLAAPLLLVLVGIAVSLLPFVPPVEVDPEWILEGVLPPLLYSAAVSLPAMEFRRDFRAISGLSILLVVVSAVVLGLVFDRLIPGVDLAWGIALGAIVSPTDAVATTIVKRLGVTPRVVAMLEGESLLNDATALVLLRAAIAGTAASVSLWSVAGGFLLSVVVAGVIGYLVGRVNLWVRARIPDATVNTVLSFTVPFLAAVPTELVGGSGLVAAVVAGLVTGSRGPRVLTPQHRLSDAQNWRTVELVLEGAVFLVMGLELSGILVDVEETRQGSIRDAVLIAALALVAVLLVRALYVAPLLLGLARRGRRGARVKPRIATMQEQLADPEQAETVLARIRRGRRQLSDVDRERFSTRVRRLVADIDYFLAAPLGWREGTVVVWAGMRGAVTLAAAQTLPRDAPSREFLILVAFVVAAGSLLIQGGTLAWVVRLVRPAAPDEGALIDERRRLLALLEEVHERVRRELGDSPVDEDGRRLGRKEVAVAVLTAQRQALLDARDDGLFSAELLATALLNLDADQISIELKGGPDDRGDGAPPPPPA